MKPETWVALYAAIIGTSAFLLNLKAWFDSGVKPRGRGGSRAARGQLAALAFPNGGENVHATMFCTSNFCPAPARIRFISGDQSTGPYATTHPG
jgi:hypothetical protein